MRVLIYLVVISSVILWSSCRKDFDAEPSVGNLEFSTDTLLLDTVFTNIGSSTYNFKVYNRSGDDFLIPKIELERGENSNYRLNVNGIADSSFEDVLIRAQDSIFIFVETTTDIADQTDDIEFLYTDRILFDPDGKQQDVDLVALIKDATFLFPSRNSMTGEIQTLLLGLDEEQNEIRVEGFFIPDEQLTFTSEKPYVIYGFAAIPPDRTLTIEAGARIHFHENSGIIASNNSTLLVNGEASSDPSALENAVIFEGDRLEPEYSEVPGQWFSIWLTPGSKNHQINHAIIKNATAGILAIGDGESEETMLDIRNTQVYNHSIAGLLFRSTNVVGENVVVNNAGQVSLNCSFGGSYEFTHSTFANYQRITNDNSVAVLIDNFIELEDDQILTQDLKKADFTNCIIYGNQAIELQFGKKEEAAFTYNFKNCLIKLNTEGTSLENDELYDLTNTARYQDIIVNEDPDFKRNLPKFDRDNEDIDDDLLRKSINFLNIGEESAANGKATTPGTGTDITGTARNNSAPDIGAYESVEFEK